MSKDEIAKQLEELQKHIKEQERLENLRERQKAQSSSSADDIQAEDLAEYYDEDEFDEDFENEDTVEAALARHAALPERNTVNIGQAAATAGSKKSGCGCGGCFSFIILLLVLGMIVPIILNTVKRGRNANYNKQSNVNAETVLPAPEETVDDDSQTVAAPEELTALMLQKNKLALVLASYGDESSKYAANLPKNIRNKQFSSSSEKAVFFADYYKKLTEVSGKYNNSEVEAAAFYLNYSNLEAEYENVSNKLGSLLNN